MPTNSHFHSRVELRAQVIISEDECGEFKTHPDLPPFDLSCLRSHRADAHCVVLDRDLVVARCSLWWQNTPNDIVGRAGLVGHYAAVDDSVAKCLLDFAANLLIKVGCTAALGPMNQNTWRDYRFVTRDSDRERFFLEPSGSSLWRDQFLQYGFREVAGYQSMWVEDLTVRIPRLDRVRVRMADLGIRIRSLRLGCLDSELAEIFSVVRVAFKENPFYVPINEPDFFEMYRPLETSIPSDLVLLAEHRGQVVGFCFALPDLLQGARGESIDTVIVKTFGVLPEPVYGGVGQVLLEEVHSRAAARGYRYAIHALVREGSSSSRIVERYGKSFRRYALFGKELSR